MASRTNRPLRPLLPALRGGPAPSLDNQSKRRRVVTACLSCRSRKTKCDGKRLTCGQCLSLEISCEYTENPLETPHQATKRKYDELQIKNAVYEEFYSLLKTRPETESLDILRRLRSGAKVESLIDHIKNGDLLVQLSLVPGSRRRYDLPIVNDFPAFLLTPNNGYLRSPMYKVSSLQADAQTALLGEYQPQYLKPYHGAQLVEPILDQVTPSRWTTVISDKILFRRLLSAYIIFQYASCPVFRKELFLQDMAQGRTRFCSQLLVNTVLACATQACNDNPAYAQFWLPQSLQYQFLAEAKRLWELESDKGSLTTIQAGVLLNFTVNMNGMDKQGLQFSMRALKMADELKLWQKMDNIESVSMQKAREFTAWGFWLWTIMYCYYFLRPPLVSPPEFPAPDPEVDPEWYGEVWIQYSQSAVRTPILFGHVFRETVRLRLIQADIATESFGEPREKRGLSFEQALVFKARLDGWLFGLPEPLSDRKIVLPSHISLHLEYHGVTLTLFRPYQPVASYGNAQQTIMQAKIGLEILIRLYSLRHSFTSCNVFLCNFLVHVGNIAIQDLNDLSTNPVSTTADASRSTLILCAQGLKSQSSYYYLGSLTFRALRDCISPTELPKVGSYLSLNGNNNEVTMAAAHIQAHWPLPHTVNLDEDPKKGELRSLIQEYSNVSIE